MVLAMLVIGTVGAAAAEDFDVVGGFTYNTFNLSVTQDGETIIESDDVEDDLQSGMGFFIGGRYWVKDDIAVGIGYDTASSNDEEEQTYEGITGDYERDISLSGPYAEVVYSLNESINLNAAVASYSYDLKVKFADFDRETVEKGSGLGFIIGGELDYSINEDFAVVGGVNYRMADLGVDESQSTETGELVDVSDEKVKIDMSGMRANIGVSYSF